MTKKEPIRGKPPSSCFVLSAASLAHQCAPILRVGDLVPTLALRFYWLATFSNSAKSIFEFAAIVSLSL